MSSEWPLVAVEDVCELIVDCVNKTAPIVEEPTPYRMIRTTNVRNGRIDLSTCRYVVKETYEKWTRRARLQPGDVILTREAPIGEVGFVNESEGVFLGQRLMQYRADPKHLDPRFLLYSFLSPALQHQFRSHEGSGSVVSHIRVGDCFKFKMRLPPLSIQQEIAALLGALDERIALLRETNATLEAIAQALFKSWFVDFDPVHSRARGEQPAGLAPEVAALFPDSFDESELGRVPKGWGLPTLYELADYINGAAYKAFQPNLEGRGFPIIKIAELKAGVSAQTAYSDLEMKEKYKIDNRDILFAWSGNPDTSIDTFVWSHGEAWLNQHIFKVAPYRKMDRSFVLMLLKFMRPAFADIARDKQTTGLGHVTVADLKRLLTVKPDDSVLLKWNEIVDPIIEQSFIVIQQAQTLATLRDTLLPRLISGQLRLPDAEQQLKDLAV